MKINKILSLVGISLLGLSLSACNKPKDYSNHNPAVTANKMNKQDALQIMRKGFSSAQVEQKLLLTNSNKKVPDQTISNQLIFGGKPTVVQLQTQSTNGKKKQGMAMWVTDNKTYLLGKKNQYYYVDYAKFSGHTYADLLDILINNYNITNPDPKLVKAENLTKHGEQYVLSAQLTDKAIMKNTANKIMTALSQSRPQKMMFDAMNKEASFKTIYLKAVFQQRQLVSYKETIVANLGKNMQYNISQEYTNFNRFANIKVPQETANAKKLPEKSK